MPTSELTTLDAVIDGLVPNGVHAYIGDESADEVRSRAAAAGWVAVTANAAGGKGALLDGLAATGAFPAWFGHNWDALSDCLVDLSWAPAEGYLVFVEEWSAFEVAWPRDAEIAAEVLAHAAAEWSARGTPFVALTR
jgi:hypothetical protein